VIRATEPRPDGPTWAWLGWIRSCALAASGRTKEAIEILEPLHHAEPDRVRLASMLGYCYGIAGEHDKAQSILRSLRERRDAGHWVPNYDLALIECGLGNRME